MLKTPSMNYLLLLLHTTSLLNLLICPHLSLQLSKPSTLSLTLFTAISALIAKFRT